MSSITSAELNYLIFRYLNESGFTHTAFTLGYEARINESSIDGNLIPPGALVTFIQKGIQYLELEANLSNDGDETDEDFQFLHPLELITKDVSELRKIVKEKKEKIRKDKSKEKAKKIIENGEEHNHKNPKEKDKVLARVMENEKQHKDKEKEWDRDRIDKEKEKAKGKEKEKSFEDVSDINHMQNQIIARIEENGANGGPEPMDVCLISVISPCEILNSDVTILRGHTSEVVACAWNPTSSHLASSSGDSTARIWTIDGPPNSNLENGAPSVVLRHFQGGTEEKQHKDATTVDWNAEGKLLAVGSYDGQARIWSREGQLISTLSKHKGPIFALKWNKKGDFLLSGSVDKTAIVWDVNSGSCWQQFGFHSAVVLDVDWRNNTSFATCSIDSMIYVCKVGDNRPIRSFSHEGEVNAVKWDPTGSLLASCSDDTTAKIWSMKQDKCLLDLRGHNREIYTVKWSPTGQGTMNPNKQLMLASASFDSTVKLWDVDTGRLVHSLNGHRDHVYSISFSPNAEYLASGSLDGNVHIWSVKEAKIVRTFSGKSGIFEVCWNREGNKISACFSDSVVCVLDLRM